jgi:hypothetical protein
MFSSKMNKTVFRRIGLNVPSHIITQLSIAKTGVIQIFLNNLRSCISLSGANIDKPIFLLPDSRPAAIYHVPPPVYDSDSLWYKYNLRHHLLTSERNPHPAVAAYHSDDFDYQWQKKQAQRVLKQNKANSVGEKYATKSLSHPEIQKANINRALANTPGAALTILPPLTTVQPLNRNPFVPAPAFNRMGLAAAKIELDNKNEQILEKEDEVLFLKGQLKRMETLVQKKNARIQDLLMQLERAQAGQQKNSYHKF